MVVTDETGTAMVSSDEESVAGREYASRPGDRQALGGDPVSGERHSDTLDTDLVYVAVPVLAGDDVIGAVRITVPGGGDRRPGRRPGALAHRRRHHHGGDGRARRPRRVGDA